MGVAGGNDPAVHQEFPDFIIAVNPGFPAPGADGGLGAGAPPVAGQKGGLVAAQFGQHDVLGAGSAADENYFRAENAGDAGYGLQDGVGELVDHLAGVLDRAGVAFAQEGAAQAHVKKAHFQGQPGAGGAHGPLDQEVGPYFGPGGEIGQAAPVQAGPSQSLGLQGSPLVQAVEEPGHGQVLAQAVRKIGGVPIHLAAGGQGQEIGYGDVELPPAAAVYVDIDAGVVAEILAPGRWSRGGQEAQDQGQKPEC